MFDTPCQLQGVVFPQEEIHIVELNGVGTVVSHEMGKDCSGALWRFHAFFVPIGCMNPAETAVEGTADAGMVYCGTLAKERRTEVLLHGKFVKGRPGKLIRPFHWTFSVVP